MNKMSKCKMVFRFVHSDSENKMLSFFYLFTIQHFENRYKNKEKNLACFHTLEKCSVFFICLQLTYLNKTKIILLKKKLYKNCSKILIIIIKHGYRSWVDNIVCTCKNLSAKWIYLYLDDEPPVLFILSISFQT